MLRFASLALVSFLALGASLAPLARAQEAGHEGHDHGPTPAAPAGPTGPLRLKPVGAEGFRLPASLWQTRLETVRTALVPAIAQRIEDEGLISNFTLAAGKVPGQQKGGAGADGEVYRALDAIGRLLVLQKDPALEARADGWIAAIAAAQGDDGYLNTFVQSGGAARWQAGELAAAGDLFEAAVAYRRGTGKTQLLDVAKKLADHLDRTFGPGRSQDPGAEPGVERALVTLSEATSEARYLALAKFLVDARGAGRHGEMAQDKKPLRDSSEVVGDPERAARYYAGAARVARVANDDTLVGPLQNLFQDLTRFKMHVTGGVPTGASGAVANVTAQDSATLACRVRTSIAVAEWAHEMFLLTGDARYADVVDTQTNNMVLAALAPTGVAVCEAMPLEGATARAFRPVSEGLSAATWVARFVASVPDRTFALGGNTIYVAQYVSCVGEIPVANVPVRVKLDSDWPFAGRANFELNPAQTMTFALKLRRPAWCREVVYQHDLKEREHSSPFPGTEAGWEPYERKYEPTDGARAHFLSPIRRVEPPASVAGWAGRTAFQRGPLVYVLEGLDNRGSARAIAIPTNASLSAFEKSDSKLVSIRAFKGKANLVASGSTRKIEVHLVPYFVAGNRGDTDLVVWVPAPVEEEAAKPQ